MLTEYIDVLEFPRGVSSGTIRYELADDEQLRPVEQPRIYVGEIIDYRVECDCGETFWTWDDATGHVDEEHLRTNTSTSPGDPPGFHSGA